jgi:hypothetical protein
VYFNVYAWMLHVAQYVLGTFLSGIILKFERLKSGDCEKYCFLRWEICSKQEEPFLRLSFLYDASSEEEDTLCLHFPTETSVLYMFMQKICSLLWGTNFVVPGCIFKVYRFLDSSTCRCCNFSDIFCCHGYYENTFLLVMVSTFSHGGRNDETVLDLYHASKRKINILFSFSLSLSLSLQEKHVFYLAVLL